ncbi:MAG: site-specific DNA-methyltransferase [Phycisphaerales bacterium]|nr:site-specific DNA-methyltransferase [Hyphomonadaceae bacterium]
MTLRPARQKKRRSAPKLRHALKVEQVAISSVRPRSRNPRRHSEAQIAKIMDSILEFGFTAPLLVTENGEIIGGHGRHQAALRLGLTHIPIIRLTGLSDAQIRALVIADNQLAALSSWDEDLLASELEALVLDDSFEVPASITGFESAQIDALVYGDDFAVDDPADAVTPTPPAAPVSQLGDIWRAEGLSLMCGDALNGAHYAMLLGEARADQVITDPPYNVKINGHVSGKGRTRHREFVQGSGELSDEDFISFLAAALKATRAHATPGAFAYVFMDSAHLFHLFVAARAAGLSQKALCTWAKTNAGMGSFYRSQTEHCVVFKTSEAGGANNIQLGRFGRNRTTLWSYPGMNSFSRKRDAALALHPTIKPVGLLADAILDASPRGGLILDPFAGSGSTLIAAARVGRRAAGLELDPIYVDGAIGRISAVTGTAFKRASDGALWSELADAHKEGGA